MNPTTEPAIVYKGTHLGVLEALGPGFVINQVTPTPSEVPPPSKSKYNLLSNLAYKENRNVSDAQSDRLFNLLLSYSDIFADGQVDMGRTDLARHTIDTGLEPPVLQAPRCIPLAQREDAKRLTDEMLQADTIRPSRNPWVSPIVLVKKKNGSLRFCVDYMKLNKIHGRMPTRSPESTTLSTRWPMPDGSRHSTSLAAIGRWKSTQPTERRQHSVLQTASWNSMSCHSGCATRRQHFRD